MRDGLFRGKRIDNDEWIIARTVIQFDEGSSTNYYLPKFGEECIVEEDPFNTIIALKNCNFYKIKPDTFTRYTGMMDQDGEEMFQGDILVSDQDGKSVYSKVEYVHSEWRAVNCDSSCKIYGFEDEYKVVGNIFDNQNLLK